MMPDIHVVHGDACEPEVLEHAQIGSADLVIAATGDDEDNLVVSMLSKHFGREKVFARINHPKNEWLFTKDFGVDVPVSSTSMMLSLVEKEVGFGDLVTLLAPAGRQRLDRGDHAAADGHGGRQDAHGALAAGELPHHGDHHPDRRTHDRQGRHAAQRRRRATAHLGRRSATTRSAPRSASARTRSSRQPTWSRTTETTPAPSPSGRART